MLGIGYIKGTFDVLNKEDLEKIDKAILENKEKGNQYFALGIYDDSLFEEEVVKNAEDRSKIAKYIKGVDFTFVISEVNEDEICKRVEEAFKEYIQKQSKKIEEKPKKYDIAYAPGTYDVFHAGHLEHLLVAAENSKKLIVGVKSDELVKSHKGRNTVISEQERVEILKHFKFVYDTYIYNDRDPHIAAEMIKAKYGKNVEAVYLGSDLKKDFEDIDDLNIIFTERDPKMERSTSNYVKKIKLRGPKLSEKPVKYTKTYPISLKKDKDEHDER